MVTAGDGVNFNDAGDVLVLVYLLKYHHLGSSLAWLGCAGDGDMVVLQQVCAAA